MFLNFLNNVVSFLDLVPVLLPNEILVNESFEFPNESGGNGKSFYRDLTNEQKEAFVWFSAGNYQGTAGCTIVSRTDYFPPFIDGNQAIDIQLTAYIEQTIHLNIGTYLFSTYYVSFNGEENNPIEVSIDGQVLTTITQLVNTWTLFTHTFNITKAENKKLKLEGLNTVESHGNSRTGIDLVALSRASFPYIPIPNDIMISNTETQKGADDYEATQSSVGNHFTGGVGNAAFEALDGKNYTFWHCQYINPDSPYTTYPYHNGIYQGGGSLETTFETIVSGESVLGEWLQIKLPSPIILKSFDIRNRVGGNTVPRFPKIFTIAGSTDNDIWENLLTKTLDSNPDTGSGSGGLTNFLTSSRGFFRGFF
jgi:hypothetical protein